MLISAFAPAAHADSPTINGTVGVTSSTITIDTKGRLTNARFVNSGSNEIFINIGATGTTPTADTTTCMSMLPNTVEVFTVPPNAVVATIAASTGNTLRVTVGEGL